MLVEIQMQLYAPGLRLTGCSNLTWRRAELEDCHAEGKQQSRRSGLPGQLQKGSRYMLGEGVQVLMAAGKVQLLVHRQHMPDRSDSEVGSCLCTDPEAR